MRHSFQIAIRFLFFSVLLFVSCQSGQKEAWLKLELTPGQELPIKVKVSDVSTPIVDGKATRLSGYTFRLSGKYVVQEVNDRGVEVQFLLGSFQLDTLREMGSLDTDLEEIENAFIEEFNGSSHRYTFDPYAPSLMYLRALSNVISGFRGHLAGQKPLLFANVDIDLEQLEAALQGTENLFLPVSKGQKWAHEFTVQNPNSSEDALVSLDWELIRVEDRDLTFFGKGGYRQLEDYSSAISGINVPPRLKRYQFMLNPVISQQNRWIWEGTLEMRTEGSRIQKTIAEDSDEVSEIAVPVSLQTLRIVYSKE